MKLNLVYSKEDLDQTTLQEAASRADEVRAEETASDADVDVDADVETTATEETQEEETAVEDTTDESAGESDDTSTDEEAGDSDDDTSDDSDDANDGDSADDDVVVEPSDEEVEAEAEQTEAAEDLAEHEENLDEAIEVNDELNELSDRVQEDREALESDEVALRYATMAHRTILNRIGAPVSSAESYGSATELEVELEHSLESMSGMIGRILTSIKEGWKRFGQVIAKRVSMNKKDFEKLSADIATLRTKLSAYQGDVTIYYREEVSNASKIIKEFEDARKAIVAIKDTGSKTLRSFISVSGDANIAKLCDEVTSGKVLADLSRGLKKVDGAYVYEGFFGKYTAKLTGNENNRSLSCKFESLWSAKRVKSTIPAKEYLKLLDTILKFARDIAVVLNDLDVVANSDVKSIMKKDFGEISSETARQLTRAISISRDIVSSAAYFRLLSSVYYFSVGVAQRGIR